MVIKSVELETVCGITSSIPDNQFPEIAFAGKSNVGKSSLINALMNRKSFARVSEKPGKTQTVIENAEFSGAYEQQRHAPGIEFVIDAGGTASNVGERQWLIYKLRT